MASKNTEHRNGLNIMFVYGMDTLEIRTSGGSTVLSTHSPITWDPPATGATDFTATVTDSSADATGTAAEARLIHTNGTASGYLVNNASAAIGDSTMPVDTGTGTFLEGDVITFAGDTQQYIITKDHSSGAGTIEFFPPLVAAPADNAAITLGTAREVSGMTVGTSGSDINLDSTSITSGQQVSVTALAITTPAATA